MASGRELRFIASKRLCHCLGSLMFQKSHRCLAFSDFSPSFSSPRFEYALYDTSPRRWLPGLSPSALNRFRSSPRRLHGELLVHLGTFVTNGQGADNSSPFFSVPSKGAPSLPANQALFPDQPMNHFLRLSNRSKNCSHAARSQKAPRWTSSSRRCRVSLPGECLRR